MEERQGHGWRFRLDLMIVMKSKGPASKSSRLSPLSLQSRHSGIPVKETAFCMCTDGLRK